MHEFVINFGVPLCLFVLMMIVGTELQADDLRRVAQHPRATLLCVAGQLILLPPLVLLVAALSGIGPLLTTSLLLLSLCPGGAISNAYTYLARCNVSLAVSITAAGTLCSLLSIPLWLAIVARWTSPGHELVAVPALTILSQLLLLMLLPLCIGAACRGLWPGPIRRMGNHLRVVSLAVVLAILLLATWSAREDLYALAGRIALSATLFILGAMILGRLLARGQPAKDRPVLVIESAVRNIGIATIIGRILFSDADFRTFAGFLTGYFLVEVLIMLPYARFVRNQTAA